MPRRMPQGKSKPSRMSSGGSLGAMLVHLDMSPESLADQCDGDALREVIHNCLECPTHAACTRWLADPDRRPGGWRAFCPNAGRLGAVMARAVRRS